MKAKPLIAVFLLGLATISIVGLAAAANSPTMPYNETVSVTNDTSAIKVTAENIGGDGTLNATVYGIHNGTETKVKHVADALNTSGGVNTDTWRYQNITPSDYGSYRVKLSGNSPETILISPVNATASGGMLPVSGFNPLILGGVALLVIGGVVYWSAERRS